MTLTCAVCGEVIQWTFEGLYRHTKQWVSGERESHLARPVRAKDEVSS